MVRNLPTTYLAHLERMNSQIASFHPNPEKFIDPTRKRTQRSCPFIIFAQDRGMPRFDRRNTVSRDKGLLCRMSAPRRLKQPAFGMPRPPSWPCEEWNETEHFSCAPPRLHGTVPDTIQEYPTPCNNSTVTTLCLINPVVQEVSRKKWFSLSSAAQVIGKTSAARGLQTA